MKDVLFVACTRGRKEDTDLYRSLSRLGVEAVRVFENNRDGLPARYNAVLDEVGPADRILAFVHDDVVIDDAATAAKLTTAVERGATVVGLAGSSAFRVSRSDPVTMWLQPPPENWSGAVRHRLPSGEIGLSRNTWYGVTPKPCVVLDGLFLAVYPPRLGKVRFDRQFAFHFYDLDFCLAAHHAGLSLSTTDVGVIHLSGGAYGSQAFLEAQRRFRRKWGESVHAVAAPEPSATG
jgi:GT2 family glycosyltransferase